jgi:hypothetical protein
MVLETEKIHSAANSENGDSVTGAAIRWHVEPHLPLWRILYVFKNLQATLEAFVIE